MQTQTFLTRHKHKDTEHDYTGEVSSETIPPESVLTPEQIEKDEKMRVLAFEAVKKKQGRNRENDIVDPIFGTKICECMDKHVRLALEGKFHGMNQTQIYECIEYVKENVTTEMKFVIFTERRINDLRKMASDYICELQGF
jgi:hypothetical protein